MRLIRNSAIALLVVASAVVFAANGIEVLSVDPLPGGATLATTQSLGAPPGSYVEAVVVVNGIEVLASVTPVNPLDGIAAAYFPFDAPGNRVVLRDPLGNFLGDAPASIAGGYEGHLELD